MIKDLTDPDARTVSVTIQKWGGIASFLMAVSFVVAPTIYLTGNLRHALGPFNYALADFLYGPVWAAGLVTSVLALRERMGERAPHRMALALLVALVAAAAMVGVDCIRSSNRHYHMIHTELNLEDSTTVLVVWTTLVTGVNAIGWHFLGWVQLLVGSVGWTSRRLPRVLSVLYLVAGTVALFVYLQPDIEDSARVLGVAACIWQGILLWKAEPRETGAPDIGASQPNQA
jgi:hypothetical protein